MTTFNLTDCAPGNPEWVDYNKRAIVSRCRTANDPVKCVMTGMDNAKRIAALVKSEQKRLEHESYVAAYELALDELQTAQ